MFDLKGKRNEKTLWYTRTFESSIDLFLDQLTLEKDGPVLSQRITRVFGVTSAKKKKQIQADNLLSELLGLEDVNPKEYLIANPMTLMAAITLAINLFNLRTDFAHSSLTLTYRPGLILTNIYNLPWETRSLIHKS